MDSGPMDSNKFVRGRDTMSLCLEVYVIIISVSKSIKMEVQGLPTDTMNNLPSSIIQKIVTHMPIRDAFRTSILSKNWRDYCLNLSKLKFDDEVFQAAALKYLNISYKLLYVIYPILLLHKGLVNLKLSKKNPKIVIYTNLPTKIPNLVNEFIIINIPKEDVEPEPNLPIQEIIILDPDDQPMWKNVKIVASTPTSAIVQPNVDDNFVINSTHLKMISKNKFDGIQQADPHDHIREFLAICNMYKYDETQSEAVKLLIFPFSLCDEAKTWFNELNEESIISWKQMRRVFINRFFPPSLFNRFLLEIRNFSQNICESLTEAWLRLKSMLQKCHRHGLTKGAIIQVFYHGLDEFTQAILDKTAGGIFLYKSPNQAFQFLDDKVLFEHDWPIKSKIEHHRKFVSFADGSDSNTNNSRFMKKSKAMDSQIISLNKELQDIHNKYNELKEGNASTLLKTT
ncbi:reverse transcriptase domain-containing protein [Tanacetum coccineum]